MKIKRFVAPDMRTALRMVRDEQGPDAVILSNRPTEGGIEVVAATDYDEALVQQALRAAAPATVVPIAAARSGSAAPASRGAGPAVAAADPAPAAPVSRAEAMIAALTGTPHAARPATAQAEVASAPPPTPDAPPPSGALPAPASTAPSATAPGDEFRAILAQLTGLDLPARGARPEPPPAPDAAPAEPGLQAETAVTPRSVHTVPAQDPTLAAMRAELATMRELMERQLGELALERLRGSPARAAALDALLGHGCDDALAREIAAALDPCLEPAQARAATLGEFARRIPVAHAEPIEDGGVIALVGPTGAGKTTTAAKLAARFAARHRARDVALVTTDTRRAGAREQLQAHGRRLGITVCEAQGTEDLERTLAQLVDYPLVLVDTAGYAIRDRALLGQILWLRSARSVRSLLVLPANAHPQDLGEVIRRYRPAAPEAVVLTKTDETSRLGAALSLLASQGLGLAYTTCGQHVPDDLDAADPAGLALALEKSRRAADNPFALEDRHAVA